MTGIVYLIHFDGGPGLHVTGDRWSRHYLGWSTDRWSLGARVAHHAAGRGARLCKAAVNSGHRLEIARLWIGEDRHFERALKNGHQSTRLCPICALERGQGFALGPRRPKLPRAELDVIRGALARRRHRDAEQARQLLATIAAAAVVPLPGIDPIIEQEAA